jgi:hypothetical protein
MNISGRSGQRSRRGEAEFWKSWRKRPNVAEIGDNNAIPHEQRERLQLLLDEARAAFFAADELQAIVSSEEWRRARELRRAVVHQLENLRKFWRTALIQDPRSTGHINWDASLDSWFTRGAPIPALEQIPDYVGLFLGRTIKALEQHDMHQVQGLRSDSTAGWREALEPVVEYYRRNLGRKLSGAFADHTMDPPANLPESFLERAERAKNDDHPFYPIPKHESQWFLYDCMRYVSPVDSDTRVLRSLLKQHWLRTHSSEKSASKKR